MEAIPSSQYKEHMYLSDQTHVANIDDLAWLASRSSIVGELIGWIGRRVVVSAASWSAERSWSSRISAAATTTETAAKASTATVTTTTSKAATETAATAEASTATIGCGTGEAILADFKKTTLPIIAIELLDSLASILGGLLVALTSPVAALLGAAAVAALACLPLIPVRHWSPPPANGLT